MKETSVECGWYNNSNYTHVTQDKGYIILYHQVAVRVLTQGCQWWAYSIEGQQGYSNRSKSIPYSINE